MLQAIETDTAAPETEGGPGRRLSRLKSERLRIGAAIAVVLALAGFAAAAGFHWWVVDRFMQGTNDAFLQADQVTVAPKVSGYVEEVLVADNQEVAAGQPLVRIDTRNLQARLEQAKAQADQERASIAQVEAQIRQQEAGLQQAEAQQAGSRTSAAFAAREVERYAPLVQSGAEPGERLDQLRQNHDQADAQAAVSTAQVTGARRQIDTLKAQIQVAKAQSEAARAQVRQTQNDIDDAVVRASVPGRVGDRTVRTGQYVQPGARLMTVVPLESLYLTANFKETQLGRLRPGEPVEIKVDALGGQILKGQVDSFAPGTGAQFALIPPNNATGNFTKIVQRVPVRIRVDAPANVRLVLVPGLSVSVRVDTRNFVAGAQQARLSAGTNR